MKSNSLVGTLQFISSYLNLPAYIFIASLQPPKLTVTG